MGKSMHVRLVAYEPFGRRLGVLPEPVSFSASIVHNDDGALNLTYSKLAKDGDIIGRNLEQGLEIAVEVSDGGPYVEPDNARYLVIGRSGDQMDPTGTITIDSAPSISWLFSKILNNDTSHLVQDGDNKGKRAFLSSNAGTILKTMLDENRGRGGSAAGLTLGFDTAKDAAGAKWAKVYTLYYSLGVSMQSALSSLVGGGAVDWRTSGRAMKVWNADSANLSRELDGKVILRLSKDVTEAPYEESISELASDILVEGDNGLVFRMDNPAAPKPWGKWETYVSQGGVSDEGTARAFMDATLQDAARVRGQYTRGVNIADAPVLPLIDYHPGDWITAPTVNHGEKVRIQEIDLSMEQGGALTASLALNDIRYDSQVKANKKLQGITGGATLAGSEGGRPAPEQDHRVPKKPLGVVASSDAYIDETGQAHGVAFVGWGEVTQATNDTSIEIDHYEVQYQRTTDRSGYWRSGATATELKCSFGRLDCGGTIRIRVRAIPTYSDRPGEWSDVVSLVVASDVTPPSVPSKPILTSKLGVVEVRSDGKNSVGGGFEPDTSHLIVGRSESDGNWVEVGTLVVGGVYTQIGLTLEHTYWFALRSIDYSGNKSAWSAGSSVKVDPAVSQADLNTLGDKVLAEAKADTKAQVDKVNTALADTNKKVSSNAEGVTAAKQAAADAKKATETNAANIAKSQAAADAAKTQSDSNKKLLESQGKQIEANESGIAAANTRVEQVRSELTEKVTEAQSSADSAKQAAATAQSTADKADAGQQTANAAATAAQKAAATATSTANTAKGTADAAKTAADAAAKSASDAKQTAANANTTANTANKAAAAAQTAASDAKTTAAEAKTTAGNASKVATQSQATANSAAQSATSAQTAADRANEAAASAAGIANGKADVLIQSAAPPASMRKATTLWIDTTNGSNKPKRWNGSAWVVVTDKAATDAAAAAATAQTAADKAQSTASAAQTAAANAAAKAQTAADAAEGAQTTADGKSSIWRQSTEPKSERLKPGDLWYRTQEYWTRWKGEPNNSPSLCANFYTFWKGEPNNSPSVLVPLEDRIVEVLMWNGSAWGQFNLVASNVLATGTVDARLINADDVYAITIQGGQFITANGRLKLTDAGIVGKDATGNTTLAYDSSNGSVSLRGAINSGSTMTGTTITGSTFKTTNGRLLMNDDGLRLTNAKGEPTFALNSPDGSITTNGMVMTGGSLTGATVNAGVLNIVSANFYRKFENNEFSDNYGHFNSSGMMLGDKLAYDAAKGTLTLRGPVQSGGDISGATITGGTIQTSSTANRGVKLTSGGLVGYGDDGKTNTVLHTSQYTVNGTTYPAGSLELNGGVWSNGGINSPTVDAGVFTGPVIRSSASSYPRFELNGTSLQFWDSSKTRTILLSGDSGSTYLRGVFETTRRDGQSIRIDSNTSYVNAQGQQVSAHPTILFTDANRASNWPPYIGADLGTSSDLAADLTVSAGAWNASNNSNAYMTLESGGGWRIGSRGSAQDTAWSCVYGDGEGSNANAWIYAGDANGHVGMHAGISTGYAYFGGYLGQLNGRGTFVGSQWKWIDNESWGPDVTVGPTNVTWSPSKYGVYVSVANSDGAFGSIFAHTLNTRSASGCQVIGYNAGNATMTGDMWCAVFSWLIK